MQKHYHVKLKDCKRMNISPIKSGICLVLVSLLIVESVFVINLSLKQNHKEEKGLSTVSSDKWKKIQPAANISLFEDPFTRNFDDIGSNLLPKYKSNLDLNATTFSRLGDENGTVIDKTIYSIDNLLLYKSLLKEQTSNILTYYSYRYLKQTPLWYQGNISAFKYGFIRSINGTTGAALIKERYLLDNLMPIFLLIENDVHLLTGSPPSAPTPKELIQEMFLLINSTEFWDDSYKAFRETNSSTDNKYVESNFYAILANILIHRTTELDDNIQTRAYTLANMTMSTLVQNLWDNEESGFNFKSGGVGSTYKYLSTNALGIISLLEYWLETGKKNNSVYLTNATLLYKTINDYLWNSTFKAYEYRRTPDWLTTTEFSDNKIDLESNALMMSACLKLFDVSGNITYYDKAIELFNSLEQYFYDKSVKSYNSSVGSSNSLNDGNKNLSSNLRLCEAYLNAFEIYNSTYLISMYNVSDSIPNLILNQDTLQIESNYSLVKTNKYFNPVSQSLENYEIRYDIPNATITHIFRYPNETIIRTDLGEIKYYQVGSESASTKITCKASSNALNGTYFNLTTPSVKFYVWFNLSNSGGINPGFSDRIAIEVKLSLSDSAVGVAGKVRNTLQNYGGVNNVFITTLNGENVTVTNKQLGELTQHMIDGSIPRSTNFTFIPLNNGANKTVNEYIHLFPITENLTISTYYAVDIFTNITYFKPASTYLYFNIISGLENETIQGLSSITYLYQGQTINITLPINNNRIHNITLNVTLEGKGIFNITKEINFTAGIENAVKFNITALINAKEELHSLYFIFKRGNIVYLTVKNWFSIKNAIDYENLIFSQKIVSGGTISISLTLINFLPNNTQSVNITFSGANIITYTREENLGKKEWRSLSYPLESQSDINEDYISIKMEISKGNSVILTSTITIEIVPKFEVTSISFPEKISQGETAYLILIIVNNQQDSAEITLLINDIEISLELSELIPGENKITYELIPTTNPYDFQKKNYEVLLKDGSGDEIFKEYLEIEFTPNTTNFVFFYLLPIVIPIVIVLYYGNKYLKLKALRK